MTTEGRPSICHAFEAVVVVVDVLRRGRDRASVLGIEDDQVGIAADGDRALAREQPEELGGLGAGRVHEAVEVESASLHAVGVEQVDALFDAGNAVGDLRERVLAEQLLRCVERAVVRADGVDEALLQARSTVRR